MQRAECRIEVAILLRVAQCRNLSSGDVSASPDVTSLVRSVRLGDQNGCPDSGFIERRHDAIELEFVHGLQDLPHARTR
jgi:hypothetical protein